MSAGLSARYEAQRSMLLAEDYERLRDDAARRARCFAAAAAGEESVGATLRAVEELGWTVLVDRRWGRRSNVDFLLAGPGGVVVVDAKNWRDLQVQDDHLFRGEENCDSEIEKNLDLRRQVVDSLSDLGLTPSSVQVALVFQRQRLRESVRGVHLLGEGDVATWLVGLPRRLDDTQVGVVGAALAAAYPAIGHADVKPARAARRHPAMPRVHSARASQQPVLFEADEIAEALVQAALAAPVEEWMTFLHPAQRRLVSLSHRGPARVRGSAGTGKTVVGLHRAAHLARTSRAPIHFVTFVRTLPAVLRRLAMRLDPGAAERIEFSGLHQLARRVLDDAGVELRIDLAKAETQFNLAWKEIGRGSVLVGLDERSRYWREEIDYVIKGRGITDFGDYAALARTGRRTRMTRDQRELMWDLYVAYERNLAAARIGDVNDLLIAARDLIACGDVAMPCGGVIVDEVQDLTMVGLQFLHALAGDGDDRFLIIGDGQQSVYPGGFTLVEAGVDVRGRATVLEVNYRNTVEIVDAATRVIGTDVFEDLEGVTEAGRRSVEVRRHGAEPIVHRATTLAGIERALLAQARTLLANGVRLGDLAVLCMLKQDAAHFTGVLRRADLQTVDLLDYDGLTSERIKIGTVKRAKGLEFAHVFLPCLADDLPVWAGESHDSYEERVTRHRRETFVAMTRARDGLWLGYLDS